VHAYLVALRQQKFGDVEIIEEITREQLKVTDATFNEEVLKREELFLVASCKE
jgi:hypothetical protein